MITNLNTAYTPIDMATWPRRTYFYYFTKLQPTGFSLTITLDVTQTLVWTTKHGQKFNAAYLYLVSRLLTQYPELRIGKRNEQLVTYDVLHPSYTVIHADHTIANLWTAYDADFSVFHQRYLDDLDQYGSISGPMPKAPQLANLFTIGSLPWLDFTSYVPLPFTPLETFFPIFQAGKFTTTMGKTTMSLSLTSHHATVDGYHVSRFLNDLQHLFNHPKDFLDETR